MTKSATKSTAVAAPIPASMMNRGMEQEANPMDSIHTLKIYNPAPNNKADPELAGHLLIKKIDGDGKYEKFSKSQEVNILKVRQGISGSYPKLDENEEKITNGDGDYEREFAFTEEFPAKYFANTNKVFFKSPNGVTQQELGTLKKLIKTPMVNGRKNPFYKAGVTQGGDHYDGSFLSQGYIIYGVFRGGELDGDMFRLLLSRNSFGVTYRDGSQVDPDVGTMEDALRVGQKAFQDYIKKNDIKGTFDDSLVRTTLGAIEDGNYFRLNCTNTGLETTDNTDEFEFINELYEEYKRIKFGSNQGSFASLPVNQEVEALPEASDQVTAEDVEQVFPQTETVQEAEVETPAPAPAPKAAPVSGKTPEQKIKAQEEISVEDIPF